MKKRILSFVLCICMVISMLPATAFAALLENDPDYNREILAQLTELCGSEDEAEQYYSLLQQYNLLDEDGNAINSWTITMDGEDVTLADLRDILAGDYDPDKLVLVDDTPISLGDLATVLEIEDYIAYLRETYFTDGEWTQEQLDNLRSLHEQINTEGIMLLAANDGSVIGPSGVDHTQRITVPASVTLENGRYATENPSTSLTVTLAHPAVNPVSLNWKIVSGSASGTIGGETSGTLTFGVGESSKTLTVQRTFSKERWNGGRAFVVEFSEPSGALFAGDKSAASTTVEVTKSFSYNVENFSEQPIAFLPEKFYRYKGQADGTEIGYVYLLDGTTEAETKCPGTIANHGPTYEFSNLNDSSSTAWIEFDTTAINADDALQHEVDRLYISGQVDSLAAGQEVTFGLCIGYAYNSYHPLIEDGVYTAVGIGNASLFGHDTASSICHSIELNDKVILDPTAAPTQTGANATVVNKEVMRTASIQPTDTYLKYEHHITVQNGTVSGFFSASVDSPYLLDTMAPTVKSVTAPAGTYSYGQYVPITVTFSEPVKGSSVRIVANGQTLSAVDTGSDSFGKNQTFLYPVSEVDNRLLMVTKVSGAQDLSGKTMTADSMNQTLSGVTIAEPEKSAAITGFSAAVADALTSPKLNVTVNISNNSGLTSWLGSDFTANEDGSFASNSLFVSVDNQNFVPLTTTSTSVTGGTLTATIPLELNTSGASKSFMPELYLKTGDSYQPVIGRYDTVEQGPAVFVTANDLILSLSVKQSDGETDYVYADSTNTIYVQDAPKVSASYVLNRNKTYSFAGADQFVWSSSNTDIANIDQNGTITPTGKAGTVSFTLTARNGDVAVDGASKAVTVTAGTLTFGVGLTPFLLIPNHDITSTSGQDVTVYWTSNLCDKNGDANTDFAVTVKKGSSEVYATTVRGTAASPAASVTIPGDVLAYDYSVGGLNSFTVEISSPYAGKTYKATATISLESKPAVVTFDKLDSYYITDTGSVDIGWKIENFDQYSSSDLFKFEIMKNDSVISTGSVGPGTESTTGSGRFTGRYTLPDISVTADKNDPSNYRDVYTVTIQAKNGSDSTWSYDSFLLYVYDADALKIWVDGEDKSSVTMSNVSAISKMTQDEILALKRDINLKNIISVNYGEYAWSEIADQIKWKSSDNRVASVNYQQGTLYENIENFTYVSYRPTSEFGLSGLSDGTATITATHKLAGMSDTLDVTVETLKDKLYLFQCYPQTETTLTYTNGAGQTKTVKSDDSGAAAIYEESGIASDVYCTASLGTYLGTFYQNRLETGEGDWTLLERYPCNNLNLRRAAYAYLYLKNPDGTPYTGSITFRGGVYVNGEYKASGLFALNSELVNLSGNEDQYVDLGSDGKLTIVMDQTQWGLPGNAIQPSDQVEYVFEIAQTGSTTCYPVLLSINATTNQDAYISSGEAVVTFRENTADEKRPFIAMQAVKYGRGGDYLTLMDCKTNVGPSQTCPEASLTTVVMWWGEDMTGKNPSLQLKTDTGIPVSDGEDEFSIVSADYPFASTPMTAYTIILDEDSLSGVVDNMESTGLELEYYADGSTLTRKEPMTFKLTNLLGVDPANKSSALKNELQSMGNALGTNADTSSMEPTDQLVSVMLKFAASDSYTTGGSGLLNLKIAPTTDPTKFLGFISVTVGELLDDEYVSMPTGTVSPDGEDNFKYTPGRKEMMMLAGLKTPQEYANDQIKEFNKVLKGKGVADKSFGISGYMESLIYYDFDAGKWAIQILNGGFKAGGGLSYSWNYNIMCGPVPVTASFTIGGNAEVGMDALSVAYYNKTVNSYGMGNDFLTELRIYLYMRCFAGIGIDYSIIAFKLGIFGQLNLDMRFQWLNRPYMKNDETIANVADGKSDGNKNGQSFMVGGQVGLQFVVKFLFVSYEKVFASAKFDGFGTTTGQWDVIQSSWASNQEANRQAISELLGNGSLSLYNVGGQQMVSVNLAPTLESRTYLEEGSYWDDGGFGLFALDSESALKNLQYNAYPYANPLVSEDGQLVVYLSDMDSTDVERTRAAFATKNGTAYQMGSDGTLTAIDDAGYGDSQLSLSGTQNFAVAAWTRQTASIEKDEGAVLTADDQMIMMNSTEVCASVYTGSGWTTTQLSSNASPDLAPVATTNGKSGSEARAIVAWRSVSSSSASDNLTSFDERDTIVYRIYNGTEWGAAQTLYNGTSGAVKAIVAAMLDDGTAAVAYTLDTDSRDTTTDDREIVYAVVDKDNGEVSRSVRATNDGYLDENPQLTAVKFGEEQRFVLGWYSEQAVASDSATVLDGGSSDTASQTVSDIRLLDFNADGVTEQRLPDSISQVADAYDVSITSNFRFIRGSDTISDLSILWVERAEGEVQKLEGAQTVSNAADSEVERDVLKSVKFYIYGAQNELISFTGAIDVAEMPDGTLIDHFDAYVSNPDTNEIKAVILGSTYGADGTVTQTRETVGGNTVEYTVPSCTTSMYTATEIYQDKIEVPALYVDYETVRQGAKTQIQFTIDNKGIHAIDQLDITVNRELTTYKDLNLLPGGSIQLYADYTVPIDEVVDPDYTVQAHFDTNVGASGSAETQETSRTWLFRTTSTDLTQASGSAYLDLPDIEITNTSIVKEEDGKRTIQIKLNNKADAALTQGEHKVRLNFFSDASCEKPITGLNPVTITSAADFAMINEGGYSVQTTFDVGTYVKDGETVSEIPETGVNVYIKAEILDAKNNDKVQGEPTTRGNYAVVSCDNLKVRTGQDVTLTSDLSVNNNGSTVTVTMQNNRLAQTATGNLIVTLLDADGKVLDSKQSYTGTEGNNGLITLNGEQKLTKTFTFTQQGASVQVTYSDVILGANNADLTSLTFSNIPGVTLDSFTVGEDGIYRYTVSTDDLTSTAVMAVAESGLAKVRLAETDEGNNVLSKTVPLIPGETSTISVTVTSNNGVISKTYILTVQNNGEPVINDPTGSPDPGETSQYSASTFYAADSAVISLTAAANGDYALSYQWYSCDADGKNTEPLQDETASTLTIPNTTDVGVYYYRCRVIRQMLNGGTKDYWSSVASVQIKKASDNSVTLEGTTVTFDNAAHALTSVAASKTGSTLHYSTDGGQTWREDAPTFTSVGVHTVWVYATNPNYEDTAVVTADVVIQEKEGTQFKLEIAEIASAYDTYPDAIRTAYPSVEALTAALKTEVTKLGISEKNTDVYEIKLLFSLDDGATWQYATAENFPAAGVTVKLPYPEGTNRYSYNFILKHLITDPLKTGKDIGDIETMDITLEQDGIRFTADCLSPFVLGWSLRPSNPSYKVAVAEESEHGTVTVTPERARYNSTVTITAKPDDGHKVGSVRVTNERGKTLEVTDKGNGTYTFRMPSGAVTVKVTFVKKMQISFMDVPFGAYYYDAVQWAVENGITTGTSNTTFSPNVACTRAQAVTFLWRAAGSPAPKSSVMPFTDVAEGSYYHDAVLWAMESDITKGTSDTAFTPNAKCTRAQIVTFLWRSQKSPTSDSVNPFTDVAADAYYANAVLWAAENGITGGTTATTFSPNNNCTRAQIVTFLWRCLGE